MGQIGCLVVFLVILSLGVGMLVDRFLGTDGIFTALFMLGSVPVTLFLVVRVSLSAAHRAQEQVEQQMAKSERDDEV
jgi:F0F1-type ATP synthase assembly protein I